MTLLDLLRHLYWNEEGFFRVFWTKCAMDIKVCNDVQQGWNKWKRNLKQIEQLCVQRYFKPANFGEVSSIFPHHFSDASELRYGQCRYIRMVKKDGKILCCLLLERYLFLSVNWLISLQKIKSDFVLGAYMQIKHTIFSWK